MKRKIIAIFLVLAALLSLGSVAAGWFDFGNDSEWTVDYTQLGEVLESDFDYYYVVGEGDSDVITADSNGNLNVGDTSDDGVNFTFKVKIDISDLNESSREALSKVNDTDFKVEMTMHNAKDENNTFSYWFYDRFNCTVEGDVLYFEGYTTSPIYNHNDFFNGSAIVIDKCVFEDSGNPITKFGTY